MKYTEYGERLLIRISPEMKTQLEQLSMKSKKSISRIVRECLKKMIKEMEDDYNDTT